MSPCHVDTAAGVDCQCWWLLGQAQVMRWVCWLLMLTWERAGLSAVLLARLHAAVPLALESEPPCPCMSAAIARMHGQGIVKGHA